MIQQVSVHDLQTWLDQADKKPIMLDVREPWEVVVCRIPDSLHIPLHQIPLRLHELDRDKALVIHCHHGARSQQVANFLQQNGYDKLYNLQGGINSWAQEVDQTMPTY